MSVDLTKFPEPNPTKVLFPKVTPLREFPVGEVTLSQDNPLSVDLTMFPEAPTATNTPEPDEEEEELSEVAVDVVEEPLSLLVLLFLAQDKTVRLKRDMRIMYNTLFIFLLYK